MRGDYVRKRGCPGEHGALGAEKPEREVFSVIRGLARVRWVARFSRLARVSQSAHSTQTSSGMTPTLIRMANTLQPRQKPNTASSPAANISMPRTLSAAVV